MNALQTAISTLCQTLDLDPEEVQLWLDQYLGAPLYPQVQLLRLANKYQLDPLYDEIGLFQNQDGNDQPFITIDGWSKLINQHPQYAGMSLRDSIEMIDKVPTWMECTIYRNDRILPIIIKEYYEEVRTDHPSWQQMPRRMLRHRVIQQCARLAFNISSSDQGNSTTPKPRDIKQHPIQQNNPKNRMSILKERLSE
uniref:recombinase RecT n=1 Tax=Polynucleobacter sp. TaxID=2029855 RepID=UPI0040487279